jgi:hypothetical protein
VSRYTRQPHLQLISRLARLDLVIARDLPLYVVPKSTPTIKRSSVVLALAILLGTVGTLALDPGLKAKGTLLPLKGSVVLITPLAVQQCLMRRVGTLVWFLPVVLRGRIGCKQAIA